MKIRKRKPAVKRKAKPPSVRGKANGEHRTFDQLSPKEKEALGYKEFQVYLNKGAGDTILGHIWAKSSADALRPSVLEFNIDQYKLRDAREYAKNFKKKIKARPRKRNPSYKVEARVPSNIRPITHEVKVPTRTLAVLATRGYVQEKGGGNPNAYTYKSTKLGTAKWKVEAIPKVKASSGTVRALTAGSAVRKFKKTLAGRGRFKTPRGAYEISVQKNPIRLRAKKRAAKRRNPYSYEEEMRRLQAATDQIQAKRIAAFKTGRLTDALEKRYLKQLGNIGDRQTYLLNKERGDLESEMQEDFKRGVAAAAALDAKRAKRAKSKAKNPRSTGFALAGQLSRKLEELKRKPMTFRRSAAIYRLEKALEKAYQAAVAAEKTKDSEIYSAPRTFATKRKGGGVRKKKANPRRNSLGGEIKKVVKSVKKSVKKVFKRKNDGSADREEFAGKVTGFKELYFAPGTPQGLSTLGPLVYIETDKANIKPAKGMAVLCQDSNHNLYVGSIAPDASAYTGNESLKNKNLGKVLRVEYRCSKPHLGEKYRGNITWYHDFEAPLPTLKTDSDGRFIFSGGNYTIRREGITG